MKKITVIALTALVITNFIHSTWIKDFGGPELDYGYWIESTADKGYIITGIYQILDTLGPRYDMMYLVKTDSAGDTLWTRIHSGEEHGGKRNSGRCVQVTSDEGYIITGVVHNATWLVKTDPGGDTLWSRMYDSTDWSYCVRSIDDGYIIAGGQQVVSDTTASKDLMLLRVDSEGNVIWKCNYGSVENSSDEVGFSMQVTADGGFIVTGDGPEQGLWVLRTDSDGDTLWTRLYQLGQVSKSDRGYCIEPTADGGWIITGSVDYDVILEGALCLLKLDSLGDTSWTRIYNYGNRVEAGLSVKQTPDQGYIVLGQKNYSMQGTGEIWLLKTDSLGDTLWTRTFGGNPQDRGDCIQLTSDGGYIIAGYTKSYSSDGSIQVLLLKTDSLGYVDIEESYPGFSVVRWEIQTTVGPVVVLRYFDCPKGFHAEVFDASGRKVDEIRTTQSSGTILWGQGHSPGVYFIREVESPAPAQKVVLVR